MLYNIYIYIYIYIIFVYFWTRLSKNFSTSCSHTNPSVQHFYFIIIIIIISYVLLTQAHKSITTIHVHITIHQIITQSHNNQHVIHPVTHKRHACNVLLLSRDFLDNHIPNPNIEPHQVVTFLHLNDSGLDPSPSIPRFSFN